MNKYDAKGRPEKDARQTMRVRGDTYDYIVHRAERGFRTPPAQMDLLVEIHKVVLEELKTEDPEAVRAELQRLKKAGQRK